MGIIRLSILGFGNLGQHLYKAFKYAPEVTVIQVYNRTSSSLEKIQDTEKTNSLEALLEADVYILCVKDDVLPVLASNLSAKNKLVVHTSGVMQKDCLSPCRRRGVLYPVQTFSKNSNVAFFDTPIAITADRPEDMNILKHIAGALSGNVFELSDTQRAGLHLAAVFANNFVNALYAVSEDICKEHSLPFKVLKPLIAETAKKITTKSPREVQTGPAVRKDFETLKKHLELLKKPSLKELYRQITKNIQTRYE